MNFDYECDDSARVDSRVQRCILVRASLTLSNFTFTAHDVDEITERLGKRYGYGPGADEAVVACITPEFLAEHFDRKRDERNREAFRDELAARVWETVKGMTWFTDDQKVIPDDLGARVIAKAEAEARELDALRQKIARW